MHLKKLIVWCGFWIQFPSVQLITPLVNGEHYSSMIAKFFWFDLDDVDTNDMWFYQDNITSHKAHIMNILHKWFEGMCILCGDDVNWIVVVVV